MLAVKETRHKTTNVVQLRLGDTQELENSQKQKVDPRLPIADGEETRVIA